MNERWKEIIERHGRCYDQTTKDNMLAAIVESHEPPVWDESKAVDWPTDAGLWWWKQQTTALVMATRCTVLDDWKSCHLAVVAGGVIVRPGMGSKFIRAPTLPKPVSAWEYEPQKGDVHGRAVAHVRDRKTKKVLTVGRVNHVDEKYVSINSVPFDRRWHQFAKAEVSPPPGEDE